MVDPASGFDFGRRPAEPKIAVAKTAGVDPVHLFDGDLSQFHVRDIYQRTGRQALAADGVGYVGRGRDPGGNDVTGQSVSLSGDRFSIVGLSHDGVARSSTFRTRLAVVGVRIHIGRGDPGDVRLVRKEEKGNGPSPWATAAVGFVKGDLRGRYASADFVLLCSPVLFSGRQSNFYLGLCFGLNAISA